MYITTVTRNEDELIRRTFIDRDHVDRIHDTTIDDAKVLMRGLPATTLTVLTYRYEYDSRVCIKRDTLIKT